MLLRKLLCIAPARASPVSGEAELPFDDLLAGTTTAVSRGSVVEDFAQLPTDSGRTLNHYHPRPVATMSEAEEENRRRRQQQEDDEKSKKDKQAPGELEIDSAYSLHVALGRMLVVASSVAVAEQPSISLVKGHLQLIDEYDTMANRKRKASRDYRCKQKKLA